MDDRFSLRFQTTDRRGEEVRIPRTGLTVGRKPGNTLQILDNSVSGKHAELVVDAQGVLLRDLGSTNGTRVGAERVLETRLSDGAPVTFGNVEFVFRDAEAEGPALEGDFDAVPATAATSPPVPDALERVDADLVERSARRSPAALAGLGALVLLAVGAAAWFLVLRPEGQGGAALAAVAPVPGNLLGDGYSFEGDVDPFAPLDSAPQAFLLDANARRSGAQGVRAELAAGEWALHRSRAFRVGAERVVRANGSLRARADAEVRLGVEFSVPDEAEERLAPVVAWSAPVGSADGWAERVLEAHVPPGTSQARVVILARAVGADGGGLVDADDVSAVESPATRTPAATLAGAALELHGDPPILATLARSGRALLTNVEFASGTTRSPAGGVALAARVEGPHVVLAPAAGAPRPARLFLRVEGALASGGIATTGADGYRTAGDAPERDGVETILLGRGGDLVRVVLPGPCALHGQRAGAAFELSVDLAAHEPVVRFHLEFSSDKGAAEDIAHKARGAEKRGELGAALTGWNSLLDRFPYEAALVEEAEAARARLLQAGLAEVRDLRLEAERARFFALPAMYASTRERALAIAARYASSEVETDARALATALETEVATLRRDEDRAERERLTAVLEALEKRGAQSLAGEVRERLRKLEGPR